MSKRSSKIDYSIEEIIGILKNTNLPTIIVEGSDDIIVYRTIEKELSHLGISMMPVGGRKKVLDVFLRRFEIPKHVNLAFIADKDTWVNSSIPIQYINKNLLFTNGYSIENDVFFDGELWKLLRENEIHSFENELNNFIQWYALALSRNLSDGCKKIRSHPNEILDEKEMSKLLELKLGELYPEILKEKILSDYKKLLRGKSLIALLLRTLNKKGREPHHTDKALLEFVAIRPGPLLNKLIKEVESIFGL